MTSGGNKKQTTLFQSWENSATKSKLSSQNSSQSRQALVDLLSSDDDDEELGKALEESMHHYNQQMQRNELEQPSTSGYQQITGYPCNGEFKKPPKVEDKKPQIPTNYQSNSCVATSGHPVGNKDTASIISGFDMKAGDTWIYPTNYPVREYQFKIVENSLFKNTMVVLPTGLGKTFIAAVIMYNFYRWYPHGKVIFMAPTRPLVAQQIEACFKIMGIPQSDTVVMTGVVNQKSREESWRCKRVFFLTPQVLTNDLSRGICPAISVRCLIVDEAHKALGKYAYCQVVKELSNYTDQFRIVALSATPGSDIVAVQQVLSNLLISQVELRTETSEDLQPYTHLRQIDKMIVPVGDELKIYLDTFLKVMTVYVDRLSNRGAMSSQSPSSLSKYLVLKAKEAFSQNPPGTVSKAQFGMIQADFSLLISLCHAYELLLLHGIRSFYRFLKGMMDGEKSQPRFRSELLRNPDFEQLLDLLKEKYHNTSFIKKSLNNSRHSQGLKEKVEDAEPFIYGHPKLQKLEEIVVDHFKKCHSDNGTQGYQNTRVMIFSQFRESVEEIREMLDRQRPLVKVMSFIGQGNTGGSSKGLTQKMQIKVVKDFKEGGYNTLVSTCVGEEGLDIGEVDLIVCYDAPKSPIRLVQRMGRTGRRRQGRIVVLLTEGKEVQMYNQSQYKKTSIHKAISSGQKFQNLYPNSPRMIPTGVNPCCHKMYITVGQYSDPKKKTAVIKMSKPIAKSAKKSGAFLNSEELDHWKQTLRLPPEEVPMLPTTSAFLSLSKGSTVSTRISETSRPHLSLTNWLPWQCSLQKAYFSGHSVRTRTFVEIMELAQLQNGMGSEHDPYGLEMSAYLQQTDILLPGEKDIFGQETLASFFKPDSRNSEKTVGSKRKRVTDKTTKTLKRFKCNSNDKSPVLNTPKKSDDGIMFQDDDEDFELLVKPRELTQDNDSSSIVFLEELQDHDMPTPGVLNAPDSNQLNASDSNQLNASDSNQLNASDSNLFPKVEFMLIKPPPPELSWNVRGNERLSLETLKTIATENAFVPDTEVIPDHEVFDIFVSGAELCDDLDGSLHFKLKDDFKPIPRLFSEMASAVLQDNKPQRMSEISEELSLDTKRQNISPKKRTGLPEKHEVVDPGTCNKFSEKSSSPENNNSDLLTTEACPTVPRLNSSVEKKSLSSRVNVSDLPKSLLSKGKKKSPETTSTGTIINPAMNHSILSLQKNKMDSMFTKLVLSPDKNKSSILPSNECPTVPSIIISPEKAKPPPQKTNVVDACSSGLNQSFSDPTHRKSKLSRTKSHPVAAPENCSISSHILKAKSKGQLHESETNSSAVINCNATANVNSATSVPSNNRPIESDSNISKYNNTRLRVQCKPQELDRRIPDVPLPILQSKSDTILSDNGNRDQFTKSKSPPFFDPRTSTPKNCKKVQKRHILPEESPICLQPDLQHTFKSPRYVFSPIQQKATSVSKNANTSKNVTMFNNSEDLFGNSSDFQTSLVEISVRNVSSKVPSSPIKPSLPLNSQELLSMTQMAALINKSFRENVLSSAVKAGKGISKSEEINPQTVNLPVHGKPVIELHSNLPSSKSLNPDMGKNKKEQPDCSDVLVFDLGFNLDGSDFCYKQEATTDRTNAVTPIKKQSDNNDILVFDLGFNLDGSDFSSQRLQAEELHKNHNNSLKADFKASFSRVSESLEFRHEFNLVDISHEKSKKVPHELKKNSKSICDVDMSCLDFDEPFEEESGNGPSFPNQSVGKTSLQINEPSEKMKLFRNSSCSKNLSEAFMAEDKSITNFGKLINRATAEPSGSKHRFQTSEMSVAKPNQFCGSDYDTIRPVVRRRNLVIEDESSISSSWGSPIKPLPRSRELPPENDPPPSKPKKKRKGKQKSRARCAFVEEEAQISGFASSDDEDTSMDEYDASFVDDAANQTCMQSQREDIQALYLRSVKSPTLAGARTKFKLQFNAVNDDVFSQEVQLTQGYMEDSFCVDNDEVEYIDSTASEEDLPNLNSKRTVPMAKKRRIQILATSSEEEKIPSPKKSLPSTSHFQATKHSSPNFTKLKPMSKTSPVPFASFDRSISELYLPNNLSKDVSKPVQQKIPTRPISSESHLTVFVDTRELSGGQAIISSLRKTHSVRVVAHQLRGNADYQLGTQVAAIRGTGRELCDVLKKTKFVEKMQEFLEYYDRPYLILEKEKAGDKGSFTPFRNGHLDSILLQFSQTDIKVLYTQNQEETAGLLSELCQREKTRGNGIHLGENINPSAKQFFSSLPFINTATALNFCSTIGSINSFLKNSKKQIQEHGCISTKQATKIYNYIHSTFL